VRITPGRQGLLKNLRKLGDMGLCDNFRKRQALAGLQPSVEKSFSLQGERQDHLVRREDENPISLRQVVEIVVSLAHRHPRPG
jgi:hypothetical protein